MKMIYNVKAERQMTLSYTETTLSTKLIYLKNGGMVQTLI